MSADDRPISRKRDIGADKLRESAPVPKYIPLDLRVRIHKPAKWLAAMVGSVHSWGDLGWSVGQTRGKEKKMKENTRTTLAIVVVLLAVGLMSPGTTHAGTLNPARWPRSSWMPSRAD